MTLNPPGTCTSQVAGCFACNAAVSSNSNYGCTACIAPNIPAAVSSVCLTCPPPASALAVNVVWACTSICANPAQVPTGKRGVRLFRLLWHVLRHMHASATGFCCVVHFVTWGLATYRAYPSVLSHTRDGSPTCQHLCQSYLPKHCPACTHRSRCLLMRGLHLERPRRQYLSMLYLHGQCHTIGSCISWPRRGPSSPQLPVMCPGVCACFTCVQSGIFFDSHQCTGKGYIFLHGENSVPGYWSG